MSTEPTPPQRKQSTKTIANEAPAYVVGLRVFPSGQKYKLDDFHVRKDPTAPILRRISIGRSAHCDLVLDDPTVSEWHCFIVRDARRVLIDDINSKNHTVVNGVRFRGGSVELISGSVLVVGESKLVAYSHTNPKQPDIHDASLSLDEYIRHVRHVHGSTRKAANVLKMPYSTLRDWLKKSRNRRG